MASKVRNRRVAIALLALVSVMAGFTLASGPLYRLFCDVTGYGGTTQRAAAAPAGILGRPIAIRFNADVARDLPWAFAPVQREVVLPVGRTAIAYYRIRNDGDVAIVGTATFNVTPEVAGAYFTKLECFCFTEHRLNPGESADLPVQFFVDPALLEDAETKNLASITLSYTFFRAPDQSASLGDGGEERNDLN
jgi:cytochrome c oxidase assembly protein subunit 11